MARRIFHSISTDLLHINGQQVRYGHIMRGKNPLYARTLEERLEGKYYLLNIYPFH